MIKKLLKSKILQVCSECNKTNVININTLVVGTDDDKNIIILPKCSCGAKECLNRTFDNQGEHARIVNSLHYFLYKKNKINIKVKDKLDKEKDKPKNKVDMDNWNNDDSLDNNGGFVDDK